METLSMTFQQQLEPIVAMNIDWASNRAGYAISVEQQRLAAVLTDSEAADYLRDAVRDPALAEQATDPALAESLRQIVGAHIQTLTQG